MEDIKNTMAEGYLSILNPSPEYENKREKANLPSSKINRSIGHQLMKHII